MARTADSMLPWPDASRHRLDGVPFVAQHAAQGGADARLVIDDQDGRLHLILVRLRTLGFGL